MTFVKTALFHKAGEGSGGGGGGGDQHNLGWYATESALTTAHPTATDGDWAIVGATDTVWVWDSDSTAWKDTGQAGIELPDQTGHSGEFLTTDGTSPSWGAAYSYNAYSASWGTATGSYSIGLGDSSQATGSGAVAIGQNSRANSATALALGHGARVTADRAIQLSTYTNHTNTDADTFKVGNLYGNFEIMSADGTIPTARFTTDPSADGTYVPTLTIASGVATRSWSAPSGGLPSQTGQSGKFLTTDGTDASWSDKPLVNNTTETGSLSILGNQTQGSWCTVIGKQAVSFSTQTGNTIIGGSASSYASQGTVVGTSATVSTNCTAGVAVGYSSRVGAANAIQINASGNSTTNSDANTMKVANANGNFEIMDANGNLPADRLASTTGLADGNYRLRLTMASGVPTLSWVAE